MAKKAGKVGKKDEQAPRSESVAGYFRPIFLTNPKLLKDRSNQELLDRWLADHPGQTYVPRNVKQGLSNLKSVLRGKLRRKKRREAAEVAAAPQARGGSKLEHLEEMIDDAFRFAKGFPEGLDSVAQLLRRARNEVVWKLGQ